MTRKIPVALTRVRSYCGNALDHAIACLLTSIDTSVNKSMRVLVKPNLVSHRDPLGITNPQFIRAVCRWFLEQGASVQVGDSPAFGSALGVAERTGMVRALKGLDIQFVELASPRRVQLPCGISIGISQKALDAELVVNCPKLKAHSQVGITAAVKNFFGCVPGFRKAFAHYLYGDVGNRFESLILEIHQILPPSITILDGIVAMDTTGPTKGRECRLELAGASPSPVALDTVIYSMMNAPTSMLPIHNEACRRNMAGCTMRDITFPLKTPDSFDISHFSMPSKLQPVTFNPIRLLKGRLLSVWMRYFD